MLDGGKGPTVGKGPDPCQVRGRGMGLLRQRAPQWGQHKGGHPQGSEVSDVSPKS